VLLLDKAAQDGALARLELTDLWGVAGRLAARLKAIGIATPLDLKLGDPWLIRERLGVVTMRLALELRGVRCLDLERDIPDRKASWPRVPSHPLRTCAKRSLPTWRARPKSCAGSVWRRRT
jgi:nucleotidyltransferase/DNA polymerase involved in DNA repair